MYPLSGSNLKTNNDNTTINIDIFSQFESSCFIVSRLIVYTILFTQKLHNYLFFVSKPTFTSCSIQVMFIATTIDKS